VSARAHSKAWTAHALEAATFALDLPEDESTWSDIDREEYAQLMSAVLAEAAQHDAAREREGSGTANGSVSRDR